MFALKNHESLVGFPVSPTKFQGVSTLSELSYKFGLERPSKLDHRTQAELKSDPKQVQKSKSLRDSVQRRFNKPRMERAERYALYIEQVENGAHVPGGTPAITIFAETDEPFQFDEDGLMVARGTPFIAVDGETQTEARFMLAERLPGSMDWPLAVTVYHGVSHEFARVILHDYNRYAHPVSERETSAFNARGPITRAAQLVLARSGVRREQVNFRGNGATKKHLLAWDQVFQMTAGAYQPSDTFRGRNTAQHLSAINAELHGSVADNVVDALSSIVADVSNGRSNAGKLPSQVWLVAGAVAGQNPSMTRLNWAAATDAYHTKVRRGVTRMAKIEKIEALRQALVS